MLHKPGEYISRKCEGEWTHPDACAPHNSADTRWLSIAQRGTGTLDRFEQGLEVFEGIEESEHCVAISHVSIWSGSTFPANREMSLESIPSDCCVLVARVVDEVPRVVAGKVLDCAVRLDIVRCPPNFERMRPDGMHDHLAGNIYDRKHLSITVWSKCLCLGLW